MSGQFVDTTASIDFFGSSVAAGSWTSEDATPRTLGNLDGDESRRHHWLWPERGGSCPQRWYWAISDSGQ